ncbi:MULTISPECIES: hypothetical protein [Pseudovibrio]|uniref:hypothetical protein n=1 Tax=Stappiaceae TaxID=2821832 RepID=UPI00236585AF|nr:MULTISPECIES: hypothetical protein [Pseudovibrio]MDD7910656.1 hypothetical protein [Pseudovibrio exalbescens]MDX5594505.1 hypothetical protein [Pseudovibrio sp. SPO723]
MPKALTLLSSLLLVLALTSAAAQARPDVRTMTCQQAKDLVQQKGAIVLSTTAHNYDRYVAHRGYCSFDEVTQPQWVKTKDVEKCRIGSICVRPFEWGVFN